MCLQNPGVCARCSPVSPVLCVFMWTLVSQTHGAMYLEGSKLPCLKYRYVGGYVAVSRVFYGSTPGHLRSERTHLGVSSIFCSISVRVSVCVCAAVYLGVGGSVPLCYAHTRMCVSVCRRYGVVSISGHLWYICGRSKCPTCI